MNADELPPGTCSWCGDSVATGTAPVPGRLGCEACVAVIDGLADGGVLAPAVGPTAVVTPFADLGIVAGVHVQLLAVERWADHGVLRLAVGTPPGRLAEPGGFRARYEVIGADGSRVVGLGAGGGGTDALVIWDAVVPVLDDLPLPWTIRVNRFDEVAECTVGETGWQARAEVRPVTRVEATSEQPDGTCPWCWEAAVAGPGRLCRACLAVARAQGNAADRWAWDGLATGQALLHEVGTVAGQHLVLLELEQRAGWFTIRGHASGGQGDEWPAGRWSAADDLGNEFGGFITHLSGDGSGRTIDVAFAGDIDPRVTQLTVVIDRGGVRLLEVDLPLGPG